MQFHRLRSLALSLVAAPLAAQSIQITSAPQYGSPGSISGVVTGVNFATHRVAVYIHIDGAGWWTKPSNAVPSVGIRADGTFTANAYTCCLDGGATIMHAALLAPGVQPPIANGTCRIPAGLRAIAEDSFDRYGRTERFAGRTWAIKQSDSPVGPGANLFTDHANDVFVDPQGRLHLRVVRRGGQWRCSEVVLVDDIGYGTYWFTTETQMGSLDPNLTFGAFTWDSYCDDASIPAWPNREIDFEDSRWGNPLDPTTSQVVVQPYQVAGNVVRYTTPPLGPQPMLTRHFTWRRHRIDFGVSIGKHAPCSAPAARVLHSSTYVHNPSIGHLVPPEGREKFRFNLWINTADAPRNGQTAEVIISDFDFSPQIGVFGGGCGVNPARSATASGTPFLGSTVTLGVDNPTGAQRPGSLAYLLIAFTPHPSFPCGLPIPGFGMGGSTGELLLDLTSHVSLRGGPWAGPGNPVPFQLTIPFAPGLIGAAVYTQGVLFDVGGPVPIGLGDGHELCIQL